MSLKGVVWFQSHRKSVSNRIELKMVFLMHAPAFQMHRLVPTTYHAVYQALGYMCMTAAQEEAWESDPNQYVADEDDDMVTVRATCGMLLDELADRFEGATLAALATAVERRLGESDAARRANDPMWWKIREATLLAVGTLNDFIMETESAAKEEGSAAPFSAAQFLSSVLEADLKAGTETTTPAFLRGRALWVAARLAPGAPPAAAGAASSPLRPNNAPGGANAAPAGIGVGLASGAGAARNRTMSSPRPSVDERSAGSMSATRIVPLCLAAGAANNRF